jgi:hypothetical protein
MKTKRVVQQTVNTSESVLLFYCLPQLRSSVYFGMDLCLTKHIHNELIRLSRNRHIHLALKGNKCGLQAVHGGVISGNGGDI